MKHTLISAVPAGCGVGRTPAARREADAPPVSVNGARIAEAAIAQEAQNHRAASAAEARAAAARALVIRELLLDRARTLGMTAQPALDSDGREETEPEALVRQVLEQEVSPTEPTEAECRFCYETVKSRFASTEPFEAARARIHSALRARAWAGAAVRYVIILAAAARIEGVTLQLTPAG